MMFIAGVFFWDQVELSQVSLCNVFAICLLFAVSHRRSRSSLIRGNPKIRKDSEQHGTEPQGPEAKADPGPDHLVLAVQHITDTLCILEVYKENLRTLCKMMLHESLT